MKTTEIQDLYKEHKVLPHIQAHMKAVGKYAKKLAAKAKSRGHNVNKTAIYKAALLHDLFRLEHEHEKVIADFLKEKGYQKLSELVRHHGFADVEKLLTLEQKIVFYADKRVHEDQVVTLSQRFERAKMKKTEERDQEKILKTEKKIYELEQELINLLGQLPNSL